MIRYLEKTGKTDDEAIAAALEEIGLERDDVSVEIIERAKPGFLGIGAIPARVRVSWECSGEEEEEHPETAQAAVPAAETPAPEVPAEASAPKAAEEAEESDDTRAVRSFLTGLLAHMGLEADIAISEREGGGLLADLSGPGMGAVIGRRGETLDAIQHLTNYAVNHGSDRHLRISVDAENYRAKREESLTRLAEKMAEKAIKYKRSMALEPMNSYERHVIHTALQNYEGVTTASTGTEPNRRVVVSYVRSEQPSRKPQTREWA